MDASYGAPYSAVEVLVVPGLCFAFTLLFRFLAWAKEKNNRSGKWMKLAAWVPLVFGLYLAGSYAWRMFDPTNGYIYRKTMETMTKVQIAHWLVIALPLLMLIAVVIWDRTERKLGRPIAI